MGMMEVMLMVMVDGDGDGDFDVDVEVDVDVDVDVIMVIVIRRVAELGSLSSGAKIAMKIFVSNASFLRVKFVKLTQ